VSECVPAHKKGGGDQVHLSSARDSHFEIERREVGQNQRERIKGPSHRVPFRSGAPNKKNEYGRCPHIPRDSKKVGVISPLLLPADDELP